MVAHKDGFPSFHPSNLHPLTHYIDREYLAVFALCVPRKPFNVTWDKVCNLLAGRRKNERPFKYLARLSDGGSLQSKCEENRLGQYKRIVPRLRAFGLKLANRYWTYEDLEDLIGLKSSHMVGCYWSPPQRVFPLDVHTRRKLYSLYPRSPVWDGLKDVGVSPLNRRQYTAIEDLAIAHADSFDAHPWEMDKAWWQEGAGVVTS